MVIAFLSAGHKDKKKKKKNKLKDILDKVIKCINFMKPLPLSINFLNISRDEMGSMHKTLLLHTKYDFSQRKALR